MARIGRDWQDAKLGCRASQPTSGRSESSPSANLAGGKLLEADKMIDDSGASASVNSRQQDTALAASGSHNERPPTNNRQVKLDQQRQQQQTEWIQFRLRRKYQAARGASDATADRPAERVGQNDCQ